LGHKMHLPQCHGSLPLKTPETVISIQHARGGPTQRLLGSSAKTVLSADME